jgi:regulator of sigma E protease
MLNIIIGIIGLGMVVFFHESGHFMAAKLCGVKVLTFSIGWGKKLFSFKKGDTEYCISLLPLGGYCKMKGEEILDDDTVYEDNSDSLSTAPAWKKAIIYFAGPFMNLVFAIVCFSIVWMGGTTTTSPPNRIVLASEYVQGSGPFAADQAGLKTGDYITAVNGKNIEHFQDLREAIATKAQETLDVTVDRDGQILKLALTPKLDKSTGAGQVGIYPWIDPVVGKVKEGSSAFIAGLQSGDIIVSANGDKITQYMDFVKVLWSKPGKLVLTVSRDGKEQRLIQVLDYNENGLVDPGLSFQMQTYHSPSLNVFQAVHKGVTESFKTLALTVRSLKLLFAGVNLNQAVSGPIRITYMLGEITTQGFAEGISEGLAMFLNFVALINIALFFMNLLPIPALDGGQILLCFIEMIRGKKVQPKIAVRYQVIGFAFLITLMIFALFNDVIFLIKR